MPQPCHTRCNPATLALWFRASITRLPGYNRNNLHPSLCISRVRLSVSSIVVRAPINHKLSIWKQQFHVESKMGPDGSRSSQIGTTAWRTMAFTFGWLCTINCVSCPLTTSPAQCSQGPDLAFSYFSFRPFLFVMVSQAAWNNSRPSFMCLCLTYLWEVITSSQVLVL